MKNNTIVLVTMRDKNDIKVPPFALMLLSNVLKKKGFNTKVIHCTEEEFDNKKIEEIININPLFIGFSVLTGLPILYSANISKKIKEKTKEIPIVWGGIHPSLLPEQCLQEEYIDYIIQGEGEQTIVELAQAILQNKKPHNIPGIGMKINNKIVFNKQEQFIKNMEDITYDFECIDLNEYIYESEYQVNGEKIKLRSIGYYSSRGCPHDCAFCYNLAYNKRRWRSHSINKIIKDIKYLKEKYKIECIEFWDDNFFVDINRAIEILEKIDCYSKVDIRNDYITEELASKLQKLKVAYIMIGAESGSNRMLKLMKKGCTAEELLDRAQILNKYKITTQYSFILGLPTETKEELYKTIDLMYSINKYHKYSSFTVGMYMPYPGTEFYNIALEKGFKPPKTTIEWNTIDRWRNTVCLPWINNKLCLNIRHLFAMLGWNNKLIKTWVKFRIKHKIFNFNLDLSIIIKLTSKFKKIQKK